MKLTLNLGGRLAGGIENWAFPGNIEESIGSQHQTATGIDLDTHVLMVMFADDAWKLLVEVLYVKDFVKEDRRRGWRGCIFVRCGWWWVVRCFGDATSSKRQIQPLAGSSKVKQRRC